MQKLAVLNDIAADRLTRRDIGDTPIVLIRSGGAVHAYAGKCPHAGAPLEEGAVCRGRIVCPWHKAEFAVADGTLLEPPALSGLRRHDVALRGEEVWVSAEPQPVAHRAVDPQDRRTMLVIGSGAAGAAAVAALCEFGFPGRIVLAGPDRGPPYDRTALSKFVLSGDMAPDDIPPLLDPEFLAANRIERITAPVIRVDQPARIAHFADGSEISYAAALAAPGGAASRLAIPGVGLPGIHTLRDRADAAAILAAAPPGARVVIVGNSFIGLEAASALRQRGHGVTVVAEDAIPFVRQFGPEIGAAIKALHEAGGVVFRSGSALSGFAGASDQPGSTGAEGAVRDVLLADGSRMPADLVLMGVGVRPATGFLDATLLGADGSVAVDAGMRAADGLYAAGDVACFPLGGLPTRIEHWRMAQQQARIAARNMLGRATAFEDVPFFWTYHFGKRYEYLGHAARWDDIHIDGSLADHRFVALLVKTDQVAAVVACQREADTARLAVLMRDKLPLAEALAALGH